MKFLPVVIVNTHATVTQRPKNFNFFIFNLIYTYIIYIYPIAYIFPVL